MRFIDLFSGIGGFRLGMERNGHKCVWSCDNYKYANIIYEKRFGGENHYTGDIERIKTEEIPDFDILCAGFPCQAFSIAGQRKGFEDTRGNLFFEIARIVEAKRPELLFLENVKGLLSAQDGYCFQKILETLDELGYDVEWQVLNSKHFGVSQNRERVFIIGHLRGTSTRKIFPLGEDAGEISRIYRKKRKTFEQLDPSKKGHSSQQYRVYDKEGISPTLGESGADSVNILSRSRYKYNELREVKGNPTLRSISGQTLVMNLQKRSADRPSLTRICDCGSGKLYKKCCGADGESGTLVKENETFALDSHCGQGVSRIVAQRQRDRHNKNEPRGQQFEPRDDGITNTLTSFDKDNYIDVGLLRRLTPTECERLQGFPDRWTEGISDTQRYKCLGNAVTVNVIEAIGKKFA